MELDERTVDPAAGLSVTMHTDGRTITVSLVHAGETVAGLTTEDGRHAMAAFNHPFAVIPDAAWPSKDGEATYEYGGQMRQLRHDGDGDGA